MYYAAGLQGPVEREHELDGVRHEERDPVALLHPAPGERRGEPVGGRIELRVRDDAIAEDERGFDADFARDLAQAILKTDLAVRERRGQWRRGDRHDDPSPAVGQKRESRSGLKAPI